GKVEVGTPAHIQIETLQIGTDLRALLSRRIEHGVVRLYGARIELPLPTFTMGSSAPAGSTQDRRAPVDLVSIDEIVLRDVAVTSGTRTVHGDIELVPHGGAVTIRRASLHADDAAVE